MKSFRTVLLFSFLWSTAFSNVGEWLELSAKDGRLFEVKVISVTQTKAEVEMRDGTRHLLILERLDRVNRDRILNAANVESVPEEQTEEKPGAGRAVISSPMPTIKFETKVYPHFKLHTTPEAYDLGLAKTAEDLVTIMFSRLPSLKGVFEDGKFKVPGRESNPADVDGDGRFRYHIYVTGDREVFLSMYRQYVQASGFRSQEDEETISHFHDVNFRFSVFYSPRELPMPPNAIPHALTPRFFQMVTRSFRTNRLLYTGAAYAMEHRLFGHTMVQYTVPEHEKKDDSPYVESERNRESSEGSSLASGTHSRRKENKPPPSLVKWLQESVREGLPVGIEQMMNDARTDIGPVDIVMAFPLFEFLTLSPERVMIFEKALKRMGTEEGLTAKELAAMYGYDSVDAFDKAWLQYIRGKSPHR